MPIGEKPNIQGYFINGKEWDGNPGDIEPPEIETEPEVQAVTLPSIGLTLPITPELNEHVKMLESWLTEAGKLAKYIKINYYKTFNSLFDRLLYEANDNPRWWHLYKHAKKARTRKKYKRLLIKQLHSKLRASAR